MGFDFTYEDMSDRKVDEDVHKLQGTETIAGRECYVVENISREGDYMYSKTITWVDKEDWIGRKKKIYDQNGELLKVLTNKQYREIEGILTVVESEMHNVQEDDHTVMWLKDVEYNTGISAQQFTERMMKRGL